MRKYLLAFIVLAATCGAVSAQEAELAASAEGTVAHVKATEASVQRREPGPKEGLPGLRLRMATVADVDLNGDGRIGFDELLRFDVTKDF